MDNTARLSRIERGTIMGIHKKIAAAMFISILGMSGYCIVSGQTLPFNSTQVQAVMQKPGIPATPGGMREQTGAPIDMNDQFMGNMIPQSGEPMRQDIQPPADRNMSGNIAPGSMNISDRPVPQGNTGRPSLDRNTFNETARDGSLTQSSDRSYVYTLGDVQDGDYYDFMSYIETIESEHASLVNRFRSDGWRVVLTTADLDELLFNGSTQNVAGATVSSSKTIYVEAGQYSYCIIHEFGHYMDYKLGMISEKGDFTAIYSSEGGSLSEYGKTDSTEFFAEAYMYSILEPDTLSSNCPQAYDFIEKCKNSM